VDRESLAILKRGAAAAEGLPLSPSDRLVGDTFSDSRIDARKALRAAVLVSATVALGPAAAGAGYYLGRSLF
jgi:hypothetical protein